MNVSYENPFATKAQRHKEKKYKLSFPSPPLPDLIGDNWGLGMLNLILVHQRWIPPSGKPVIVFLVSSFKFRVS